jgi:carotenoid cleavage dioxygenase-like enzyme
MILGKLSVEGRIPSDPNGMLVRNGPNPAHGRFSGNDTFSWFIGDGMLHGLRLEDGEARGYRNRSVETGPLASRRGGDVEPDTPANTNVYPFAGRSSPCSRGSTATRWEPSSTPRVNDDVVRRVNRYGYAVSYADDGVSTTGLITHDFRIGKVAESVHGAMDVASEPVFAQSSEAEGEDEGYLVHTIYDASTDTSSVDIRDTTDLAAPPVARVPLPVRIPRGFHGNWIRADELSSAGVDGRVR